MPEQTETPTPAPKFTKGDLVVNTRYGKPGEPPNLVVLDEPTSDKDGTKFYYGLHFVQNPHLGYPTGGSMWSTSEEHLRYPESGPEVLLAMQYTARARAIAAAKEAESAAGEADAVDKAVAVFQRTAARSTVEA